MNITTVGIDLTKSSFSVHGVDRHGKVMLRKTLSRAKLLEQVVQLPRCVVGLEACGGAHEMARRLQIMDHDVRLMAAKFVAPQRAKQKNDGNDAEAICEAVSRPKTRFVPIKSAEQQAVMAVHRIRQELIRGRTSLVNQLRGLLAEFGVTMVQGRYQARAHTGAALEAARIPALAKEVLAELRDRSRKADDDILAYDRRIDGLVRHSEPMQDSQPFETWARSAPA